MNRPPANTIRLVLLDNERLLLESLSYKLNSEPDISVVYAGDDCQKGVRACIETSPDIAVVDIDLQERDPFDIAIDVSGRQKKTRFLFIANRASDIMVEQAIRVQAFGFLFKHESLELLTDSIRRISRGEYCFSIELEERVVYDCEDHSYAICRTTALSSLTDRQLEVLRHLALGQSTMQTARSMHLAEKSIESHTYRIMKSLGIHNRVQLARFAIREGLVTV